MTRPPPFTVRLPQPIPEDRYDAMFSWCRKRFGKERRAPWHGSSAGVWGARCGPSLFLFEHENDAFEFKMRWG